MLIRRDFGTNFSRSRVVGDGGRDEVQRDMVHSERLHETFVTNVNNQCVCEGVAVYLRDTLRGPSDLETDEPSDNVGVINLVFEWTLNNLLTLGSRSFPAHLPFTDVIKPGV